MSDIKTGLNEDLQPAGPGRNDPRGVWFSNVKMTKAGRDVDVTFDISWQGSWLDRDNWDAVWVFFKYSYDLCTEVKNSPGNSGMMAQLFGALDAHDRNDVFEVLRSLKTDRGAELFFDPYLLHAAGLSVVVEKKGSAWRVEYLRAQGTPVQEFRIERVKDGFTITSQNSWAHARVGPVPGNALPDGVLLEYPNDGMGVFIRRSQMEGSCFNPVASHFTGVLLRLQFEDLDFEGFEGEIKLWPFGLQMVYVPSGPFWLGDPQVSVQNCFYDSRKSETETNRTYLVDSEAEIELGDGTDSTKSKLLWFSNNDDAGGVGERMGAIPPQFPKGFQAFYIMKHQITQGEYASFLNTLYGAEPFGYGQLVRYPYEGAGAYRNTIYISNTKYFTRAALRPWLPCNYLSWSDALAYAAWAGLRPMTELEYEKACRGDVMPVAQEYAWGTTTLINGQVIVGREDGSEFIAGNCNIGNSSMSFRGGDGGSGPVRGNGFAAFGLRNQQGMYSEVMGFKSTKGSDLTQISEFNSRELTGLSRYGIPGLTGNLWELCVTAGTEEGRGFSGKHGDGKLERGSEAPYKALGWPNPTGQGPSWRGGSWFTDSKRGYVAARPFGSGSPGYIFRTHDAGFRCVRTAPVQEERASPQPDMAQKSPGV